MVEADIRLDAEVVLIDGARARVTGTDFEINHAPRRPGTGSESLRRALVHDDRDGLTINFAGDYPAGVVINGCSLVLEAPEGPLFVVGVLQSLLAKTDTLIPTPGSISAEKIELIIESLSPTEIDGRAGPKVPVRQLEDLGQIIYDLRQQVGDLQRQIEELKK
jgi:hypothetical protein